MCEWVKTSSLITYHILQLFAFSVVKLYQEKRMKIFIYILIVIVVGALFCYFIGIKFPLWIAGRMEKKEEKKRRKKSGFK